MKTIVWEPGKRGWRRVRARVPARPRSGHASERVPRPPSFRFTAAGAEDVRARPELAPELAPVVELVGAQLAREVAREVVDRFGSWATAAVVAWLVFGRKKGKR